MENLCEPDRVLPFRRFNLGNYTVTPSVSHNFSTLNVILGKKARRESRRPSRPHLTEKMGLNPGGRRRRRQRRKHGKRARGRGRPHKLTVEKVRITGKDGADGHTLRTHERLSRPKCARGGAGVPLFGSGASSAGVVVLGGWVADGHGGAGFRTRVPERSEDRLSGSEC